MKKLAVLMSATIALSSLAPVAAQAATSSGTNVQKKSTSSVTIDRVLNERKGTTAQLKKVDKRTMKFVKSIAQDSKTYADQYKTYPSIVIAKAVVESNSGKTKASKSPQNNLFNLKNKDIGVTKSKTSLVKYGSKKASIKGYSKYLSTNSKFKASKGKKNMLKTTSKNYEAALKTLEPNATKRNKLKKVIKDYNLTRFDSTLASSDKIWLKSSSLDPFERPVVTLTTVKKSSSLVPTMKAENYKSLNDSDFNVEYSYQKMNYKGYEIYWTGTKDIKKNYLLTYNSKGNQREAMVEEINSKYILISEGAKINGKPYTVFKIIPLEKAKKSMTFYEVFKATK